MVYLDSGVDYEAGVGFCIMVCEQCDHRYRVTYDASETIAQEVAIRRKRRLARKERRKMRRLLRKQRKKALEGRTK